MSSYKKSEKPGGIKRMNTMKTHSLSGSFGGFGANPGKNNIFGIIAGGASASETKQKEKEEKKKEDPKPVKRKESHAGTIKGAKTDFLHKDKDYDDRNESEPISGKIISSAEEDKLILRSLHKKSTMNPIMMKHNSMLTVGETYRSLSPDRLLEIPEQYEPVSPKKGFMGNLKNPTPSNVRVVARFRPINQVEMERGKDKENIIVDYKSNKSCKIGGGNYNPVHYTLDRIFNSETKQETIFKNVAKETIDDIMNGFNGTIFTYGQSGSGKTFTMYGTDLYDDSKGIVPRSIDYIWDYIEQHEDIVFELKFSMIEIYKEVLYDLLNNSEKPPILKIKEHPKKGPYIEGVFKEYIENKEDLIEFILLADELRATAETGLNKTSSRSHLLFTLEIIQKMPDNSEKIGILNLIDLAGSEKLSKTGAEGDRLKEALKINLSLHTLGNVIHALSSGSSHVPYAESKLTKILKNSLGGNFKTTLIVTCSPHMYNIDETISTFQFAQRAKKIKNIVKANINKSPEELEKIIEDLQMKLLHMTNKYRKALQQGGNNEKRDSADEDSDDRLPKIEDIEPSVLAIEQEGLSIPKRKKTEDANLEKLLAEKNQEIEKLRDELDTAKEEIKILNEKIVGLTNEVHFEKSVAELRELSEDISHDILKLKQKYTFELDKILQDENNELKKQVKRLEDERLDELRKISFIGSKIDRGEIEQSQLESEYVSRINRFNKNFSERIELLKKKITQQEHKNIINSYGTLFANSKMMFATLVQEFLDRDNLLEIETRDKISLLPQQPRSDTKMKNAFAKMLLVMIYYEKTVFEGLNKVSVDLRYLVRDEFYQAQYYNQLKRYFDVFTKMTTLLDQVKEMKIFNVNGMIMDYSELENGGNFNKRTKSGVRNIRKRFSTKKSLKLDPDYVKTSNSLLRVPMNGPLMAATAELILNKQVSQQDKQDQGGMNPNESIDDFDNVKLKAVTSGTEKANGEFHLNLENINNTQAIPVNKSSQNDLRIYKNHKLGITPSHKPNEVPVSNFGFSPRGNFLEPNELTSPRHESKSPRIRANNYLKQSAVESFEQNNLVRTAEYLELKSLKTELEMYRDFSIKQTEEINSIKLYNEEAALDIRESIAYFKDIYDLQLTNFKSSLEILKGFYNEDLVIKGNLSGKLSRFTDEVSDVLNKRLITQEEDDFYGRKYNSTTPNDFSRLNRQDSVTSYTFKKETYKQSRKSTLSEVMTSLLEDGGVASRKLDYIKFSLNQKDYLGVKFGSGLNKKIPSKSPLQRSLRNSLLGDQNSSPDGSSDEENTSKISNIKKKSAVKSSTLKSKK